MPATKRERRRPNRPTRPAARQLGIPKPYSLSRASLCVSPGQMHPPSTSRICAAMRLLRSGASNYIVKATAKRDGINLAVSAHWLRHAHASHAIDEGAPITLVSQTLGHADLKTTSVYAHARPNDSSSRYLKRT